MYSRFGENGTLNIIISRQAFLYILSQHQELIGISKLSAVSFPIFLHFHSIKLSNSHSPKTPSRFLPLCLSTQMPFCSHVTAQSRPHCLHRLRGPSLAMERCQCGSLCDSYKNWTSPRVGASLPFPFFGGMALAQFMFGANPGCEHK